MRLWGCVVLAVLAGLCTVGRSSAEPPDSAGVQFEDFEERIGPLVIKGQPFTAVRVMKRIAGADATADWTYRETVVRFELRDVGDTAVFARSFPYEIRDDSFAETVYASARLLQGNEGQGILVSYGFVPSAPQCGGSWQVLGLFDGQLVPFSKPLATYGDLIDPDPTAEIMRTDTDPDLKADILNFRIWTGSLYVIYPVRVDWVQAMVRPAWRCGRMTPEGLKPLCRFRVEAQRRPSGEELTFVRLFHSPDESGIAQHIVVKPDSEIEYFEAEAELVWDEKEYGVHLDVGMDVWLHVRIDGSEGWIHTPEDFMAIGLPQAG